MFDIVFPDIYIFYFLQNNLTLWYSMTKFLIKQINL